jgi:hypothetical protein
MTQQAKTKNEVAKKDSSALVANAIDLSLVAQDQGQGLAKVDLNTTALPFLKILSSMSPQTKKAKSEYIEGAEEGMIFNTVTEELFSGDEGIKVVPCFFEPVQLEWSDRGTGSSAPIVHPVDTPLLNKTTKDSDGKLRLPEGTYLERTHNHYCLLLNEEGLSSQVLLSMKVSGLSRSRKWNSLMLSAQVKHGDQVINPPSWYFSYHLTTKHQSNDKGDWYGWDIKRAEPVSADVYHAGKKFFDAVKRGSVEVNYEQSSDSSGTDASDNTNPF